MPVRKNPITRCCYYKATRNGLAELNGHEAAVPEKKLKFWNKEASRCVVVEMINLETFSTSFWKFANRQG